MPNCKAGAAQLGAAGGDGSWMQPLERPGPERARARPADGAATAVAFAVPPWGDGACGSTGTSGLLPGCHHPAQERLRGAMLGAGTNPRAA